MLTTLGFLTSILLLIILLRCIEHFIRSIYIRNIKNRYVLITGCDTGFGNLLAKRLDNKGMNVIATCLTEKGAKDLSLSSSNRLTTFILNVTNDDEIEQLREFVSQKVGENGLYALVNNAGIIGHNLGSPETILPHKVREVLNVNAVAPAIMSFKFLHLLHMANGRIINMSSLAGRIQNKILLYAMSKFCLSGLSSCLGLILKTHGWNISVHVIEPGMYRTSLLSADDTRKRVFDSYDRASKFTKDTFKTRENYVEKYMEYHLTAIHRLKSNTHEVIDAYENAILSIWPKNRYTVGLFEKYVIIPLTYLPTTISDILVAKD
ncbi:DgyrCDS3174 [Dimorphilus gyrociliatus]|uniref:DgyrCDS3174 n=1 Tax=Dimorphilus gyrociliatus TaxID=2664684 RepID=A0A7I8VCS7_9ANNE|nr:DgyrCDS3174 [Dimorphilus gyrociliatus]